MNVSLAPFFSDTTAQILNSCYAPHSSIRFLLKSEDYSLKKQMKWGSGRMWERGVRDIKISSMKFTKN